MSVSQSKKWLSSFKALLLILRPKNSFLAGIGVLIGTISSFGTVGIGKIIPILENNILSIVLAYLATSCIAAGGYTLNDFYDYEIDLVNRPDRILPSGIIPKKVALVWAYVLFIFGFILAISLLDILAVFLALLGIFSLISYGIWFKKVKEVGNVIISLLTVIPFFYGGLIVDNVFGPFFAALVTFLLSMGREIHKDIEDLPGDQSDQNMTSIPIRFNIDLATWIANGYLVAIIVLSPLPFLISFYHSLVYVIGIGILNISLLYIFSITLYQAKQIEEKYNASRISRMILKLDYFIGAFIFVLDPIFPIVI